jgi:hypothetical protein
MNDILSVQPIAFSELCISSLAAAKQAAFMNQLRSSGAMNRTIDTTTPEQR